jgi:hypothetical protein
MSIVKKCALALCSVTFLGHPVLAQNSCPQNIWARILAPGEQTYEVVSRTANDLGNVIVEVHFGPLKGPHAKVYLFAEYDKNGCLLRAVSAGSYAATVAMDEAANPDAKGRLHHMDLYERGSHSTLGFHSGPPDLQAFRATALEILAKPPRSGFKLRKPSTDGPKTD